MAEDTGGDEDDEVFAFPASFAQQRLWFLDKLAPGTAAYNVALAIRLGSEAAPLDLPALKAALREVTRRHEALRTTFATQEGAPLQVVAARFELAIATVDLAAVPADERRATAERLANAEARRPFDLEAGPLLRALVLVLGATEHVLVITVHHIVCDGWSLGLLFEEVSELYPAFAAGRPSPLPEPAMQYADYAIWQREWFQGEELERQLSFWRAALAGDLPVLALPSDRGRPPVSSFAGACLRFHIAVDLAAALNQLARREGVSLFMLLLGAFTVLLHRLSGQDEILVGTPIANRDRPEIERAIGFYTNTVVFRTDLSRGPSFRALLGRIRERALGVFAHQDVPLDKVVEDIHPARGTSWNPVFQAMFGLQRAPESALRLPGVRAETVDVHGGSSKFDLTVDIQELPDGRGLQGLFEYSQDLFDDATAARIMRQLELIIAAVAADPDRPIALLPLLGEAERRQIVVTWNATERPFPRDRSVSDLVSLQAERTPDAIAVEGDDPAQALTYRALADRSAKLARHLRALGVGPDVLVAVHLERSPALLVALLGVLRAGGAYLPLDPAYPKERLGYMLADAGVSVILTESAIAKTLPPHAATLVFLDEEWDREAPLPERTDPESLAYVIYTSGSTGKPKGVEIPHRAVVNFLCSMAREPGLGAADRLLAVTTLSFDIAGLELFLPLVVGATVIVATRETASDGAALLARLSSSRATVLQATPTTFRMLIDAGWTREPRLRALCGGEALPTSLAAQLLERSAELWNLYGPTETTIWSTCNRVVDERVVIGAPIANTQVHILDKNLEPTPIGVTGELHIGGLGLARGYLGRPELSAERFFAGPFGGRLYRTGDLARRLADGSIEYLGRADNQVKLRGFRIELGEIESRLDQHPAVAQSVVLVRGDTAGDQRLVAYLVHAAGASPTASELRKFLRATLPDHMIPHLFVELARLPLTQNGKVDRLALPDPFAGERRAVTTRAAPRTEMERLVAEIWREVLNVEVGVHDNFFDLGGHSLLSMQVIHRIAARTGRRVDPRSMVFQNLEQIAAECGRGAA
jgi:amino acid adenylation domain-containing protein